MPAAAAVILMAWLHMKRTRESQQLGHEVAKTMQADFKHQLESVCASHERMQQLLIDTFRQSVERIEKAIEKIHGD